LSYATAATKSRPAEIVLIPVLDAAVSAGAGVFVFTVVFFVSLLPGNTLGIQLAAILGIFTSLV
jgi:NitT/TauT family transport system permease protein